MWFWCNRSRRARSGSRPRKHSSNGSATCLPGLSADVDHWCGDSDMVFIEFRMRANVGGDSIEWPNVNRLRLCGGKGIERVTYFDPLAILPTLLRHPSIALRWRRSRITTSERHES
jgi:hypothetical protein